MSAFNVGDKVRLTGEWWSDLFPADTVVTIGTVDDWGEAYFVDPEGESWWASASGYWAAELVEEES